MAKKKEEIVELILTQHQRLTPAAEELRKKLNGIVAEYELNSNDVLMVLGRICAGYIHQTQIVLDNAGMDDPQIARKSFLDMLTAYLTSYDMESEATEMDNMNNEAVN